MKLGIMSDTHGHLDAIRKVVKKMIDQHGVETIIHLGDDSTDIDELSLSSINVIFVPGLFESRYKNKNIPNRLILEFEDIPFLLTHSPTRDPYDLEGDLDPKEAIEDGDIKVVLHGHTHRWKLDEEKGVVVINPGHLKMDDRKQPPSFAIIDVNSSKLEAKIINFSNNNELLAHKMYFIESD